MRYFVYATNDSITNIFHRIDAVCDSVSIENAYEYFKKCVRELKFSAVWLIADFENSTKPKKRIFKKIKPVGVLSENSLNYFPIAEYKVSSSEDVTNKYTSIKDCTRKDLVHMQQNGIQFSYTDNLEAVEQMQYVIDNRIKSVFTLDSFMYKDFLDTTEKINIERTILDTSEYLNREKDHMFVIPFIELDTYKLVPKEIDRVFINENLRNKDGFTDVKSAETYDGSYDDVSPVIV